METPEESRPSPPGRGPSHGPVVRGPLPRRIEIPLVAVFLSLVLIAPALAVYLSHDPDGEVDPATRDAGAIGRLRTLTGEEIGPEVLLGLTIFCIALLFGGLVLAAVPVILLARRRPARPLPARLGWDLLDVVAVILLILGLFLAVLLVVPGESRSEDVTPMRLLINAIFWGLSILIVLTWLHHRRGKGPADLGLHRKGWVSALLWGPALYAASIPLLLAAALAGGLAHAWFGAPVEPHPIARSLLDPELTAVQLSSVCLAAIAIGPLAEEILFRGFLYPALRNFMGCPLALIASSALFAALHPLAGFYAILVLGAALAYLYERTGSLLAPIAVHALHNSITIVFLLLFRTALG